jgi:hypothetical protein
MTNYLIGYDLDKPDQDYANLIDAIKTFGNWWHCLDSTWIIQSDRSAIAIRDILARHIGSSDKVLVVTLSRFNAAWTGFDGNCSSWLHNNL